MYVQLSVYYPLSLSSNLSTCGRLTRDDGDQQCDADTHTHSQCSFQESVGPRTRFSSSSPQPLHFHTATESRVFSLFLFLPLTRFSPRLALKHTHFSILIWSQWSLWNAPQKWFCSHRSLISGRWTKSCSTCQKSVLNWERREGIERESQRERENEREFGDPGVGGTDWSTLLTY